ncbi:MAG: hypothetical protein ACK2VD_15910 [Anaerolineae bacterium]
MIYKVSFVVQGGTHPGGIQNFDKRPEIGDRLELGKNTFEIIEVLEIIPPRGEFGYLHATCKPLEAE